MLLGRESERRRIERLLDDARHGRSSALVVRGEAGIGKTTLLRYAADLAEAMTLVSATGIESESEIEFSGLLELCRPLLDLLDLVPNRHAAALRGALGLGESSTSDPFAIGAGTLSLLAAAGERGPVVVAVDDAQWLDDASGNAVRFAARRLDADRVCFLFAVRDDEPGSAAWTGFDELPLAGLDMESARALVTHAADVPVADEVLARLHESTSGSPLALLELPRLLDQRQLDGSIPLSEPLPAGAAIREAFARRAERLPESTRRALGVVALASAPRLPPVAAALVQLGLDVSALEPAEDAGLVALSPHDVRFVHPLVRAAVHEAGRPSERRAAHAALAAAYHEAGDDDRSARHRAAATLGSDEGAAAAMAAAAARANERTAYAAASEAFEVAARLTPSAVERTAYLADAAESAWNGGAHDRCAALVRDALSADPDPALRGRLLMLEGRLELQAGTHVRARELFVEASRAFERTDRARAVASLDLAVWMCHFLGDREGALELAGAARVLVPGGEPALDAHVDYIAGRSLVRAGRFEEGLPLLERSVAAVLESSDPSRVDLVRAATMLSLLGRLEESVELVERICALARDDGPTALTYALGQSSHFRTLSGDWLRAAADGAEGAVLARALGLQNLAADCLANLVHVEACRGDEARCRAHADEALPLLETAGMASTSLQIECSLGLLELGLGKLGDAVARLERAADEIAARGFVERELTPVPDLVEALHRLGRHDEAEARLAAWVETGRARAQPWASALVLRCEGLLAADDRLDEAFGEALRLHGDDDAPFARARTHLCYGERLRRAGRKRDARVQLREAHALFEPVQASPWATRARRELRASGERLRRARAARGEELTPQELQVALQVAEGKTNRDVAAALFLSPSTVEFHLTRIYRKLDLSSRAELIRRFATSGDAVLEPTS